MCTYYKFSDRIFKTSASFRNCKKHFYGQGKKMSAAIQIGMVVNRWWHSIGISIFLQSSACFFNKTNWTKWHRHWRPTVFICAHNFILFVCNASGIGSTFKMWFELRVRTETLDGKSLWWTCQYFHIDVCGLVAEAMVVRVSMHHLIFIFAFEWTNWIPIEWVSPMFAIEWKMHWDYCFHFFFSSLSSPLCAATLVRISKPMCWIIIYSNMKAKTVIKGFYSFNELECLSGSLFVHRQRKCESIRQFCKIENIHIWFWCWKSIRTNAFKRLIYQFWFLFRCKP